MLNAFRHLRNCHHRLGPLDGNELKCSTPFGIYGIVTAVRHGDRARKLGSAQRLSASTELSQPFLRQRALRANVLNAFRHLRNCHLNVRSVFSEPCEVLNAFRHLRNCHNVRQVNAKKTSMCSTPFGIYGIVTPPRDAEVGRLAVCSTPFGIYGIVTLPCASGFCLRRGAQRLSASTELSPSPLAS